MRGAQAERLLSDSLLNEALDKLKAHYVGTWEKSGVHDQAGRERAWLQVQLVSEFRLQLRAVAENGHVARSMLDKLRGR